MASYILLLIFFKSNGLLAQGFSYDKITLKEIYFHGSSRIDITHDVNQTTIFTNRGWSSMGEKSPVAYVSGNKPRVEAIFEVSCTPGASVWVRGVNADGYNFSPKQLVISNGIGKYSQSANLPGWNSDQAFPLHTVNYWENFEIIWYMSTSSAISGNWVEIGTSSNPIYVTYEKPLMGQIFHSVIYHGCKEASTLNNELAIVNKMYEAFTNQDIRRKDDPVNLIYWNPNASNPLNSNFCWSTAGLLLYGDATCGAFADFFNDMIRAQGISGSVVSTVRVSWGVLWEWSTGARYALPMDAVNDLTADEISLASGTYGIEFHIPDYNGDGIANDQNLAVFLVKNWTLPSDRTFYSFKSDIIIPLNPTGIKTLNAADDLGVKGQSNDDPPPFFDNHALVKYNNKYYDPSYGTPSPTTSVQWEDSSLAGFGTVGYLWYKNAGGAWVKTVYTWDRELNPGAIQITIDP